MSGATSPDRSHAARAVTSSSCAGALAAARAAGLAAAIIAATAVLVAATTARGHVREEGVQSAQHWCLRGIRCCVLSVVDTPYLNPRPISRLNGTATTFRALQRAAQTSA